jgi:hypothetical protein
MPLSNPQLTFALFLIVCIVVKAQNSSKTSKVLFPQIEFSMLFIRDQAISDRNGINNQTSIRKELAKLKFILFQSENNQIAAFVNAVKTIMV